MYSEKRNVCQLLALLKLHGISHFVVSPGSRHVPVVVSMQNDPFFKLFSIVDERSASFFAIGLIQQLKEPVGIICTSGTASANYCSAINESLYQELPLLVITADKPECLRDQHEDQMIRQTTMYQSITKMVANLPTVETERDAWFNNRLINEALLELNHHGKGPVQINIPIPAHTDSFTTKSLPLERKIERHELISTDFREIAKQLLGKKILIACGEGYAISTEQLHYLGEFCEKFGAVVLCDKMSNCHVSQSIENSFPLLSALSGKDITALTPDIVISVRANFSFNPELKSFINKAKTINNSIENWYVHESGRVVDTYQGLLKHIFEIDEFEFFRRVSEVLECSLKQNDYYEIWKIISESIDEPSNLKNQIGASSLLLNNLPKNCILQLANSNSVRVAQLFHIDPSIEVHCNRGTDGIDGCMSTAIGFASTSNNLVYLMIGDLSFFYDMNALWNRHVGKNIRIFLVNNGGGAVIHMPPRPDSVYEKLPNYISASHTGKAKAWAEDRGFLYLGAKTEEEIKESILTFTNPDLEGPMLLEVFSDMIEDTRDFKNYYATVNREKLDQSLKSRSKRVILDVLHVLGLDPMSFKSVLKGK